MIKNPIFIIFIKNKEIAFPINVGKIKKKVKNNIDTNKLPVLIIIYKKQIITQKRLIKDEKRVIAKKDYKILE